jgi:hypothetical protein
MVIKPGPGLLAKPRKGEGENFRTGSVQNVSKRVRKRRLRQ